MDYSKYGIEDFLAEHSFQEYCLGNNAGSLSFWCNWLNDHPEKAGVVQSAKELYFTLNGNITAKNFQQDHDIFTNAFKAHIQLDEVIHNQSTYVFNNQLDPFININPGNIVKEPKRQVLPVKRSAIRLFISLIAAAACLTALLNPPFFNHFIPGRIFGNKGLVYSTPMGKKLSVNLSDGTAVVLNGGTTLEVSNDYNHTSREVILNGEAYFTVKHNSQKPFIVHTSKLNIKDLGTIFNVKAYPADRTTETSLIKGSVEITLNDSSASKVVLVPNKKLVLVNKLEHQATGKVAGPAPSYVIKNVTKDVVNQSSVVETDWTKNKLSFNDLPFEDLALQIERGSGTKIMITNDALKKYRFTASFDQESITEVLEALKLSADFNYRKEGDTIIIY